MFSRGDWIDGSGGYSDKGVIKVNLCPGGFRVQDKFPAVTEALDLEFKLRRQE